MYVYMYVCMYILKVKKIRKKTSLAILSVMSTPDFVRVIF